MFHGTRVRANALRAVSPATGRAPAGALGCGVPQRRGVASVDLARELREYRHRKVARSMSHVELVRSSDDSVLTEQDLVDKERGRLFLDYYGDEGIRFALDRYGLTAALGRRGYVDLSVVTRSIDERHMLVVMGTPVEGGDPIRIIELVVRRDRMLPSPMGSDAILRPSYDVLTVDWLLMSSPRGHFSPTRPRLPGQELPGLGVAWRVFALLERVVDRLELDGLVTVAEYLHNAELYARELPFLDPIYGGRLDALVDALRVREKLSVAQASWAVEWGLVRDASGETVRWHGEAQVTTHEPTFHAWIESPTYVEHARQSAAQYAPVLDRAAFDERWAREHEALEK